MSRDDERDVVYVERDGGSLKPILFGALLGLAAGLLFAPQSGAETRRALKRRLRKARALAEEKIGELSEKVSDEWIRPAPSPAASPVPRPASFVARRPGRCLRAPRRGG